MIFVLKKNLGKKFVQMVEIKRYTVDIKLI